MDHSQNIQDYVSVSLTVFSVKCVAPVSFLPRCIECRRSSRAKDVLSVRPSVKRVDCDKTEEKSVPIFIPTKNHLAYTLLRKKMVAGGGQPHLPKIWVNRPPLERNRRFWTDTRS